MRSKKSLQVTMVCEDQSKLVSLEIRTYILFIVWPCNTGTRPFPYALSVAVQRSLSSKGLMDTGIEVVFGMEQVQRED